MELTELSKIGLTQGEIKVYSALIKHGAQTKSHLAKNAEISSSKVYEISEKLIKKGLANSFIKNKITHYNSSDPIFLKKHIENKEKELREEKNIVDQILPDLQKFKKSAEEKISFELYEGWKGLQNSIWEALLKTPENSEFYAISEEFPESSFMHKFHRERIKKNIKVKLILSQKKKKIQSFKKIQIKYLEGLEKTGMVIYPDRILIQSLDKIPLNLVIQHPRLVQTFKIIFNSLWKQAKS